MRMLQFPLSGWIPHRNNRAQQVQNIQKLYRDNGHVVFVLIKKCDSLVCGLGFDMWREEDDKGHLVAVFPTKPWNVQAQVTKLLFLKNKKHEVTERKTTQVGRPDPFGCECAAFLGFSPLDRYIVIPGSWDESPPWLSGENQKPDVLHPALSGFRFHCARECVLVAKSLKEEKKTETCFIIRALDDAPYLPDFRFFPVQLERKKNRHTCVDWK